MSERTDSVDDLTAQTQPIPRIGTRRRLELVARLLIILLGLGMSWLILEVFMRVGFDLLPPGVQADIQAVRRVPWDETRIIPVTPFIIDREFQARLPVGLRDFPVRWSDARFTFNTISLWEGHRAGLRTEPPRWPLDILVTGDSFGFCWTRFEDCWAQRLHTDYNWNVVNASIPGTGVTGQMRLLKEIAGPMQPRLVIWMWFVNDVTDDYDLARIRGEVQQLAGAPLPDPAPEPRGLTRFSALAALLDRRLNPPIPTSPYRHFQEAVLNGRPMSVRTDEYPHLHALVWPNNQFGIEQNLNGHAEGVRYLRDEVGAQVLIVFIPTKEEAYADLLTPLLSREYIDQIGGARRKLLEQCAAQNWHCIDMLPVFQEAVNRGETVYYAFDAHLDAIGNRLVTRTIYSYIVKNALLPLAD